MANDFVLKKNAYDDDEADINEALDTSSDMQNQVIEEFKEENNTLLISDHDEKVYLPYSKEDIDLYLDMFKDKYSSAKEVVDNEFTFPLKYYTSISYAARFREAFALYKDREGKTTFESIKFAFKQMKKSNLQPAIIAACKNLKIYNDYIYHLDNNDTLGFSYFKIVYNITPTLKSLI